MLKNIFPKSILYLITISSILNIARIIIFDTYSSIYLFWNLFLGLVSYFITLYLLNTKQKVLPFFTVVLFVLWLLFLPNAPYLITDLIHINDSFVVPHIYDAIMLILYAILGLLLFLYSLTKMKSILERKNLSHTKINLFIYASILLSSFGMYLGRSKALRFNSWEVFSKPEHIFSKIFDIFLYPSIYEEAYIFTIVSFTLLSMSYFLWVEFRK